MIFGMAIAVFSKCWRGQRALARRRENWGRDHVAFASHRTAPMTPFCLHKLPPSKCLKAEPQNHGAAGARLLVFRQYEKRCLKR